MIAAYRQTILGVVIGSFLSALPASGQDVPAVLKQLEATGFDPALLSAAAAHAADPRIIPALEAAFDRPRTKPEKQAIASSLLRLGNKSMRYFEFLAGFARSAVEDRSPHFLSTRGAFSPEFVNWCALNGRDPKATAAIQATVYPEDLRFMAKSEDQRAVELFRRGLESPNPVVVAICVEGLARLRDMPSIPLIEQAAVRLPTAKRAIAIALPWYGTVEAYGLMERLEPDRNSREFHIDQVERQRHLEAGRGRQKR